jgi:hypothetical protein
VLEEALGLRVSRAGLCPALERVARKAEPTSAALVEQVRASPSVTADETGWKVGGHLWWMWAFSSSQVTVYSIPPGRGFEQAATVLGVGFEGFLVRDGLDCLSGVLPGHTPKLLGPFLRRCREMILVAGGGAREFPRSVQEIL